MSTDDDAEQERAWEHLYAAIVATLQPFGVKNAFGDGDYLVVDDNYGWKRHTVEIHKLHMLDPVIVRALRGLLNDFSEWEIVMAVDIPGTENSWPRMGLTIRRHEIIDGLRREYLPEAYRTVAYEGGRPGTGYD